MATLHPKRDSTPKFSKTRSIPYALYQKVKEELNILVQNRIIEQFETSNWAFPIVVVPKLNGELRICADFRAGLSSQLDIEQYPIHTMEELLLKLKDMNIFSKVDLSEAYFQLPLDEESRKVVVINTPFGLYRYNRFPFGVYSAPAI
ncbi:Transposon Ty3-I Gag-Pol polyprotein [Thelohanellus kitauei]|uniref:Transposon Ty3-I Gag-Pol polyprotein n=1 Tax=Thelohanellus kitauei TaxID=669202 RepID=A0A0C2MW35_THEKT|nr:Transposon Ty3-I Gag-Pol polyprotein [Thelohanellus kitauei]